MFTPGSQMSKLAKSMSLTRLRFLDFTRVVHTFIPASLILVHYGVVIHFFDDPTPEQQSSFKAYYVFMCLLAFVGSLFYFFPSGHKCGTWSVAWTLLRSLVCAFEFFAVTYVRARPFKQFQALDGNPYDYAFASRIFAVTNIAVLLVSALSIKFRENLLISPVDTAVASLFSEYGRVCSLFLENSLI